MPESASSLVGLAKAFFPDSKEQVNMAEVVCEFLDIFPQDPRLPLFERLDLVSKSCLEQPLFPRRRTAWL